MPFKIDVSGFTAEESLQRHSGAVGGPPEVVIVNLGERDGVLAARGSVRVRSPAYSVFKRLCDPEENQRIFSENVASVNYRKLIEEDRVAGTRLFESSKTGRWRLLGIPFNFESTVMAVEDWRRLEIRFSLKKQGAMRHMSGFWRAVPIGSEETLVQFYNEAVPRIAVPGSLRWFASRFIQEMAMSLLEDLRRASLRWDSQAAGVSFQATSAADADEELRPFAMAAAEAAAEEGHFAWRANEADAEADESEPG